MQPEIVHITADFPDPFDAQKTPVIRGLLELTQSEFRHRVISLNRRAPRFADVLRRPAALLEDSQAFAWGEAGIYRAPRWGILHSAILNRLGDRLAERQRDAPPALLVGHKLTVEGIVAARVARRLGIPYAVTIQGNTDAKILSARPDLAPLLAKVFHEAASAFAFSPWALAAAERRLGKRSGPCLMLPCPTDLDEPLAPRIGGDGLVSVFHLRNFRNKNLAGMASAMRRLRSGGEADRLTIIGGGDERELAQCKTAVRGVAGIAFAGPLDRAALRERLNRAAGFVLPSHRESFGLVFIEALFAGLPVIYPAGAAIDGYFDGMPFAVRVKSGDTRALATAMQYVRRAEAPLKQALREWQLTDHARSFTRPAIARQFAGGLRGAINAACERLPERLK